MPLENVCFAELLGFIDVHKFPNNTQLSNKLFLLQTNSKHVYNNLFFYSKQLYNKLLFISNNFLTSCLIPKPATVLLCYCRKLHHKAQAQTCSCENVC